MFTSNGRGEAGDASFPLQGARVLWRDGYCCQETVDVSRLEDGIVRAFVDGQWEEYRLLRLPDRFVEWALKKRLHLLEGEDAFFLGAHCGLVATYGCPRTDSRFHINNAAKGIGFLPKPDRLREVNSVIEDGFVYETEERHTIVRRFYEKFDDYFDRTRLVSLEEFTRDDFQTQTFINQMVNPACSIVFLDMVSFELKVIAHILHYADPRLNEYQKEVLQFANMIHAFGHGARLKPSRRMMAVIYYLVEAYDNSPRGSEPGHRIAPVE